MYSMKEVCARTGMSYEGLKFYCNQGLVPGVQRDAQNRRVFDEAALVWVYGLNCLRKCGLGLDEMRAYLAMEGAEGIAQRKTLLAEKEQALLRQMEEIRGSIDYIHRKQAFYDDVLAGKQPDMVSLLPEDWGK